MTSPPLIAVSSHLDDVALSSAGTILAWDGPRYMVTVFTGDPPGPLSDPAAAFHAACGQGPDAMRHRRLEDIAACEILGCWPVHVGLPEALYRVGPHRRPVITSEPQLFDGRAESEPGTVVAVAEALRRVADAHKGAVFLAPRGTGRHRDHIIVRRAVEVSMVQLHAYYEDQPYAWWNRPASPTPPAAFHRSDRRLEPAAWITKVAALACYASQMPMLWGASWREGLMSDHQADELGPTETLWSKA